MMVFQPAGTMLPDGLLILASPVRYSTEILILYGEPADSHAPLSAPPPPAAAPMSGSGLVKKTPMTDAERSKNYRERRKLKKLQAESVTKRDDSVTRRDEIVTNRDGFVTRDSVCVLNLNNINKNTQETHTLIITPDVTPVTEPSRNVTPRRDANRVTPPVKIARRAGGGEFHPAPKDVQTYIPFLTNQLPKILRIPEIEDALGRFLEQSIRFKPDVTIGQHNAVLEKLENAANEKGQQFALDCLEFSIEKHVVCDLWYPTPGWKRKVTIKQPPPARKPDPPLPPPPPPETAEQRAARISNGEAFRRYLAAGGRLTPDSEKVEFREEDWPDPAESRRGLQQVGLFVDKFSVPKNPPRKTPPPDG